MQNNIIIINGPNINLLGDRDKSIYGKESYEELLNKCKSEASKKKVNVDFYQSKIEGELAVNLEEEIDGESGEEDDEPIQQQQQIQQQQIQQQQIQQQQVQQQQIQQQQVQQQQLVDKTIEQITNDVTDMEL